MSQRSSAFQVSRRRLRATYPILFVTMIVLFSGLAQTQEVQTETIFACELGDKVYCEINNPYGLARIQVNAELDQSTTFEVFDQRNTACSAVVNVQWAASLPNAVVSVTTCESDHLSYYHSFGDVRSTPFMRKSYRVSFEEPDEYGRRAEAQYSVAKNKASLGYLDLGEGSQAGVAQCYNASLCTRLAAWCDRHKGVGTCYEDHCECAVAD